MYKQAEIKRAIAFVKSDQWISANENYNIQVYKITSRCYFDTKKAIESLYGMRCFWSNRLKASEIIEQITYNLQSEHRVHLPKGL